MRKVLASLLVFLITFALVTRGVAAPLMHVHPEHPPAAVSAAHQHDHMDDKALGADAAAEEADLAASGGHDHGAPAHGKGCDTNGACCGPLAVMATVAIAAVAQPAPQPYRLAAGTGVSPDNPDRPPSSPLA